MLMKKLALIALLAGASTTNLQAASSHEIRTWGMMGAGLILTSAGAHMIYRYQHDLPHRVLDTFIGAALIAAGLYGIAAPDRIIKLIERSFR